MRILCVTSYYKPAYIYGGPVRSVSSLCEAIARSGAQVTVFTTNANGHRKVLNVPTDRPVEVDGVEVHYFPQKFYFLPTPFYSPALRHACRAKMGQFDVVYVCGSWTYPMLAGVRAALAADVPYVYSPRGSFMVWSMQQRWLKKCLYLALIERRLINGAAAIHCTSYLEQEQIKRWHFKPQDFVMPNPLDITPFQYLPERGKLRQSLGIPPNGTLSLFVGRLHRMKRVGLMIEAFAKVAERMREAHLIIAGPEEDGSGKIALEQVNQMGLSDCVHFCGMLTGPSLMEAYAEADMLILLSHRENFGMVVVEAMAAGLPVIVANEVGLAEEVVQGGAGLAVSAKPYEIAQAWQKLLSEPALRRTMGHRGRALVQGQFSSDIVAAKILNLFTSILSKQRIRSRTHDGS